MILLTGSYSSDLELCFGLSLLLLSLQYLLTVAGKKNSFLQDLLMGRVSICYRLYQALHSPVAWSIETGNPSQLCFA